MSVIRKRYISFRLKISLILLTVLLVSCQPQQDTSPLEFRVPVTVTEVAVESVEDVVVTTGTVRAPELIKLTVMTGGLLQIAANKNGRQFAEGDQVKAGEILASITGEDVRLAAKKQLVEQRLEEAKKKLQATKALYDKNLVSESIYLRDKSAFENAKLEYETSLHSENRNRIVSPIDGVILKLARDDGQLMANGQLVHTGQVIAEVASLNSLIADVDLVGRDIARIRPGLNTRASYHAWKGQEFSGRVLRLSPTIDINTRSIRAEIEIENNEHLLKPGMFVEVSVIAEKREAVTVIPRRSLTQRGGRQVVFVVKGQRAEQRIVELGLIDDQNVEIRNGVKAGEKVIVLGLETLSDQMPVRVTGS